MSHKTLDSRHAIDSCTMQLHNWRPFHLPTTMAPKTLDSDFYNPKPYPPSSSNGFHPKRPCLSDRTTSFSIDMIDMSRLSLFEDENMAVVRRQKSGGDNFRWIRKRRRRGSRSVSGRSSDRSATRRCCSVGASAAYATCSDFPVAAGTDSSGELFVSGDGNWGSDVSEAAKHSRKEKGEGEKENSGLGFGQVGNFDGSGIESGYGSEPGYRGDAEFGDADEVDEEDDEQRPLFWGDQFGDTYSNMEMVGENTFSEQKAHHRCRRKKHDWKMVD